MSKLTRRGRIVLIYTPAGLALTGLIVLISTRVWYVEGRGYCIGEMIACFTR